MSADTAASMLADLIGAAGFAHVLAPAANPANAANREHRRGLVGDSSGCEGLRIAANAGRDSQEFASVRKGVNGPETQHSRGFSQDSQNSQRVGGVKASEGGGGWVVVCDQCVLVATSCETGFGQRFSQHRFSRVALVIGHRCLR